MSEGSGYARRIVDAAPDVQENCVKKKKLKNSCLDGKSVRLPCGSGYCNTDRHCLTDERGEKEKERGGG